jgi:hypothetical protein
VRVRREKWCDQNPAERRWCARVRDAMKATVIAQFARTRTAAIATTATTADRKRNAPPRRRARAPKPPSPRQRKRRLCVARVSQAAISILNLQLSMSFLFFSFLFLSFLSPRLFQSKCMTYFVRAVLFILAHSFPLADYYCTLIS